MVAPKPKRFHGTVSLNPIGWLDASRIADEVITHLTALPSAAVRVTLEIGGRHPRRDPPRARCGWSRRDPQVLEAGVRDGVGSDTGAP